MSVCAIIPVKPFHEGKSRLREFLSDEQRYTLNRNLFINTLQVILQLDQIEFGIVVSRDPEALAIAEENNFKSVDEYGLSDLNRAINLAVASVSSPENHSVLIVPADLPLMTADDIAMVINQATEPPMAILVPDRWKQGTNILLINPCDLIPFAFGLGSFRTHKKLAQLSGANVKVIQNKNIGIDLDLPDDYNYLMNMDKSSLDKFLIQEENSITKRGEHV